MLPKVKYRTVSTILPSTKKPFRFRLMQAREEKLLLMAKEGRDSDEILSTVQQICQNCSEESDFDASKAPVFDLEWLFMQIRIESIGAELEVRYRDGSDSREYPFTIDLREVKLIESDLPSHITLEDGLAVQLKWPSAPDFLDPEVMNSPPNVSAAKLAPTMIDKVYEGDKIYDASTYSKAEIEEFVDSFPTDAYHKLIEYLAAIPKLHYEIAYKNSKGEDRKIELSNLTDFFTF